MYIILIQQHTQCHDILKKSNNIKIFEKNNMKDAGHSLEQFV